MLGRSFFRTEMSLGAGVLTKFRIRLLQLEQNSVFQKSRLCECTVKVLCRNAVFFQKHFVQPPAFEGYFATRQNTRARPRLDTLRRVKAVNPNVSGKRRRGVMLNACADVHTMADFDERRFVAQASFTSTRCSISPTIT